MNELPIKERFNKVFANLPIPERWNPIYVDEKYGPMSWHVVKLEADADTKIGLEALKMLAKMKLI